MTNNSDKCGPICGQTWVCPKIGKHHDIPMSCLPAVLLESKPYNGFGEKTQTPTLTLHPLSLCTWPRSAWPSSARRALPPWPWPCAPARACSRRSFALHDPVSSCSVTFQETSTALNCVKQTWLAEGICMHSFYRDLSFQGQSSAPCLFF